MMSVLSEDFIYKASKAPTAKEAQKLVEDPLDLWNSATLHNTVQSFFSIKMQHNDLLTDPIFFQEQNHTYSSEPCRSANDPSPYHHLLEYLMYDEAKERHLLMSLPSSMDNIIDNLQSQDFLIYIDVRSRLLEHSGSSKRSSNSKALNARSYKVNISNNNNKISKELNPSLPEKTEPHPAKQFSYWKKHGPHCDGHTHEVYNQHKYSRIGSASAVAAPVHSRDVVPHRANRTVNEQCDHVVAFITYSLPHPVPTIASRSVFKTANDKTYEGQIFNPGTCFHITADFSRLLEPMHCHLGLKVGSEPCMYPTYIVSVPFDIEIVDSVRSVTPADVLYVPH